MEQTFVITMKTTTAADYKRVMNALALLPMTIGLKIENKNRKKPSRKNKIVTDGR